jgi:HEPN domain-containing protein
MPSDAVRVWLEKAEEDERVVDLITQAGGPWNAAAYHVQQAAEKRIKATLV